ncbi:hypothetical protein [Enterobacter pseudoroggenkampii]|uniref:hypothetical protein n=1 Tax=Enterobacter pseudoroggenkampii TaxID=2996112 RepID=UPI002264CD41|nr:hypothetical protein [Enterobacter pseudoroggenkampii]MCX8289119.1 hypothetical protein [Enterobacter pseudoroggenkampii]
MANANFDVDFIDDVDSTEQENKADGMDKHKRAELAHKLAVVLLFDKKAKHHAKQKKAGNVKFSKGALDIGEDE